MTTSTTGWRPPVLSEVIEHKPGATFRRLRRLGFDLGGWSLTAVARRRGDEWPLSVRVLDPVVGGLIEIEAPEDMTATWPLGFLEAEIRAAHAGEVVLTKTFYIHNI